MDHQTQTFLDLTGLTELVELVSDRRAAWLWSSDGGRVLWANAAGAAFFSAQSISDLANLNSLERSPARPHIARIAETGFTDRFSIDRLRFYRGLRVMLLTCQCKKVALDTGETAALIVCADKGFATTKDPVSAFSQLVTGSDTSVFVLENGSVSESFGSLTGTPEDITLPSGQAALYGPLALDDALHTGALFKVSKTQNLLVLENDPVEDGLPETLEAEILEAPSSETEEPEDPPTAAEPQGEPESASALWVRADAEDTQEPSEIPTTQAADAPSIEPSIVETTSIASDDADENGLSVAETAIDAEEPAVETDQHEDDEAERSEDPTTNVDAAPDQFVFSPGRRPVRFAWKMDIDQRFTFLSDEFEEVVGPECADIVGLTWTEVADKFELDPRASIGRALDRRDTWSGKTVDWPVTGEALRVPVDMAALPAFDRNRKFEGYRGFGVCRAADAKAGARVAELSPAMTAFDEHLTNENPDASDADVLSETEAPADNLEEAAPKTAPVAETADLKPQQPDALAGKTFIGASAAALVGSLSRFTGGAKPPTNPEEKAVAPAPIADEDTRVKDETEVSPETLELTPADEVETEPLAAAALMDEVLEQADEPDTDIETSLSDTPETADEIEPSEDETLVEDDVDLTALTEDVSEEVVLEEENVSEPDEAANADTSLETEQTEEDSEPIGISGSAPLDASEIESAVKSLQKSYKASKTPDPDLFAEDDLSGAEIPKHEDVLDTPSANETVIESLEETAPAPETTEDAVSADLLEPDQSATDAIEETEKNSPSDASSAEDEEREFFEETAAFEAEELAKEFEEDLASSDNVESLTPSLGDNVIPLATVKPRVVPVDTSGLSRPERQAFRKIAEALGARLEGDLEGWDEPDTTEPEIEELPPEVPEAGPIDPTLLDRLPIGIAIVHDREVLYANKALLSMLGYKSTGALCEAGGLEALFIDDAEDLPDAEGMEGELDETMKMRLADGGVRSVDAHMHTVPWNGSRGLMISVTERPAKTAQAPAAEPTPPNFFAEVRSELENARDQISEMDTILETATDGVLVLDERGTILKVNGSAEALFSANRGDMIGAPFVNFLAPESQRSAKDYLDGLSRNGVASILNDGREILGKVPTGGLIPLFMTMGRINSAEDTKYCAVLRDITQWKTAEEELTQAKRQAENASSQKSDFLAKISHEIRTPLNAIIGFSEVMMEERFGQIGNERYKDYLKDIRTSGSHIMSLVNDLLDLSKIEAGKLDLKFSSVSANEIINECVALMQPQANRERVIIRASVPDTVPNVVADPRSLRQIVLNLLSNGIKYNKSGGQVILSTTLEPNGEVALRVRDTGAGMTPKQLAAALEPFRQLHTARRGGGTGLGLPLTKALSEANRAQFHIDSVPDQGTLVEITFPTERVLSE